MRVSIVTVTGCDGTTVKQFFSVDGKVVEEKEKEREEKTDDNEESI